MNAAANSGMAAEPEGGITREWKAVLTEMMEMMDRAIRDEK